VSRSWCVHSVLCAGLPANCRRHHASRREAQRLLSEHLAVTIGDKHLRLLPVRSPGPEPIKSRPIPATIEHIPGGHPVFGPFVTFSEQGTMHREICKKCGSRFETMCRRKVCDRCRARWCKCGNRIKEQRKRLCPRCLDMRHVRWCECGTRLTEKRKRLCTACRCIPRNNRAQDAKSLCRVDPNPLG